MLDYIGREQVIIKDLALADRPVSLDKHNLYVFRGLQPEFRPLTISLSVRGQPVTMQELADFLGAHEFISNEDLYGANVHGGLQSSAANSVQRGGSQQRSKNNRCGGNWNSGSRSGNDCRGDGRGDE